MKRSIFFIVLLVSVTAVFAQYCPSDKTVDGERSESLHLNRQETEIWLKYGNNVEALKRRLADEVGSAGYRAREEMAMLQRLFARIDQAHEHNMRTIERQLYQDKCKNVLAINAKGYCTAQLVMSPDWKKAVIYMPEGVYAAGLKIKTSGLGKCSYMAKGIVVPEKEGPKYVTQETGPSFDCNNPPPLSLYSRSYTSVHKGRSMIFRVFSYMGWEMHCANIGANFWELAKKVQYPENYPSIQPAPPVTGGVVGKIETLKRLPEGRFAGIISRTDGRSPTRLNYLVKDIELRPDQKVRFTIGPSGLVTNLQPVK